MYESRSIPSLEELEQMERRQSQAIEALEYIVSGSNKSVKCQRCGIAVPIVGKMSRPKNDTVVKLQTRQRYMENHPHFCSKQDLEAVKQELAKVLEEEATYEKLRSLPLTYWPSRGKYVCGSCLDRLVRRVRC
jgi:hypothetical protein